MNYLVEIARGPQARFVQESDAIAFAKKKSKADGGAFTWRVVYVEPAPCKQVATFRGGSQERVK